MTKITYIPGEIANAAIDEQGNRKPVTRTQHIFDDAKGKSQAEVNADVDDTLGNHQQQLDGKYNKSEVYKKEETYNKTELDNMITTPNQEYVSVTATDQTTAVTDVLPATGAADTTYRVGNWDGSQFAPTVYSEYSWNGSQYVHLSTKTQIGEVFDISAYHATGGTLATYATLADALDSNNGGGVPQSLQKGGMSIKFVQSSDNKYVQARLMADSFTTDTTQWQGVDDKPVAGSDNLINSGGVHASEKMLEDTCNASCIGYFNFDERFDIFGKINDNGTWNDTLNYLCHVTRCRAGSVIEIIPNGAWCRYAFLTDNELTDNVAPNYIDGEDGYITIYSVTQLTIPDDANYLYVYAGTPDARTKIPTVKILDKDLITAITNKIDDVYATIGRQQPEITNVDGGGFRISQNKVYLNAAAAWSSSILSVFEGERINIKTTQYGSTYNGYIITDYRGIPVEKLDPTGVSSDSLTDITITIPKDGAVLYVNNHINAALAYPVIEKLSYNSNAYLAQNIRIAAINCGKFDYGDGTTTDSEYLMNWHKALNSLDYDIIVLSDYIDTFGTLSEDAVNLLFDRQYCRYMSMGKDANLIVLSRVKNIADVAIIDVTHEIGEETTHRYKVYKLAITFDNYKKVYLYCVHLAPGGSYATMRAAQYQDIIDIINNNKESAIIAGDFNANAASEYDVFKTAGFNLGNCDYTGEYDSLRTIPADNIIVTPDIIIKKFELSEGYNLNTDHKPISASIIVQN